MSRPATRFMFSVPSPFTATLRVAIPLAALAIAACSSNSDGTTAHLDARAIVAGHAATIAEVCGRLESLSCKAPNCEATFEGAARSCASQPADFQGVLDCLAAAPMECTNGKPAVPSCLDRTLRVAGCAAATNTPSAARATRPSSPLPDPAPNTAAPSMGAAPAEPATCVVDADCAAYSCTCAPQGSAPGQPSCDGGSCRDVMSVCVDACASVQASWTGKTTGR